MGFLPPRALATLATLLLAGTLLHLLSRYALVDNDANLSAMELIRRWDYPAEAHDVVTHDGYILEAHRITGGRANASAFSPPHPHHQKPVVLLMHGLHGSSYNWISNRPEQSAGFIFADAGYDVWMGNCRGNIYGQRHEARSTWTAAFWDFSWQDMADADIPATVDYILARTNATSLYYVGHSQGYAVIAAHLASRPDDAKKIRAVFGVAPVWTNIHSWGPAVLASYKMPLYELFYPWLGSRQYHFKTTNLISTFMKYACALPVMDHVCGFAVEVCGGMPTYQMNYTRVSVYMASTPGGSSTKNMIHWAQICHGGVHRKFDYGAKRNLLEYGQASPPSYDLSRLTTRTHLFWSLDDWIADDRDIRANLIPHLPPTALREATVLGGFNHFDFIFGTDAGRRLYHPILERIRDYERAECTIVDRFHSVIAGNNTVKFENTCW